VDLQELHPERKSAEPPAPDLELRTLRAQVVALARGEGEARAQLREAHTLLRSLQEKLRLEAQQALAGLKQSLEAEQRARARAEAQLTSATNELRQGRGSSTAEVETLRALFADLMRNEAHGRQRLERLQEKVADHARVLREEREASARERAGRERAESLLADQAARSSEGSAAPDAAQPRELLQLREQAAQLEASRAALATELAEERGRAQDLTERAAAEVEWAQDRARAATQAEEEGKDQAFAARKELLRAREDLEEERQGRDALLQQRAGQLADLRQKIEAERAAAFAELARREEVAQAARAEAAEARQQAREQGELASLRRDELADQRAGAQHLATRLPQLERELTAARAECVQAHAREELALSGREESAEASRAARAQADGLQAALSQARLALELCRDQLAAREASSTQAQVLSAEMAAQGALARAALEAEFERLRAESDRTAAKQALLAAELTALQAQQAGLTVEMARASAERDAARTGVDQEAQRAAQADWERAGAQAEVDELKASTRSSAAQLATLRASLSAQAEAARLAQREGESLLEARRLAEAAALEEKARLEQTLSDQGQALAERARGLSEQLRALSEQGKELARLRSLEKSLTPCRRAALAAADGNYAEAESLLQASGRSEPGRAQPLVLLAEVQAKRGLQRAARQSYREALQREPDSIAAREGLSLLPPSSARKACYATLLAALLLVAAGVGALASRGPAPQVQAQPAR